MAYNAWSVTYGEQPSATKWNILGTNDAHFYTYTGEGTNAIQQIKNTNYTAVATGTTTIPLDDTIPQITEGTEFMTQAITPKSATNLLVIEIVAYLSNSIQSYAVGALFQDSTANALAAMTTTIAGAGYQQPLVISHTMTAGTTSSTTFRFRAGPQTAATTTFNGSSGGRLFGAITKSYISVTEYKV